MTNLIHPHIMKKRPVPCFLALVGAILASAMPLTVRAAVITVMDGTNLNGFFESPTVSGYVDGTVPTDWTVSNVSGRQAFAGLAGPGNGGIDNGQFFYWANPFSNTLSQSGIYTVAAAGEQISASWYVGSNTGLMTDFVSINGLLVDQSNSILQQSGDVNTLGVTLGGTGSYQSINYTTTSGDIGKQLGIRFNFFETFTGAGAVAYLDNTTVTVTTVPEPAGVALLGLGFGAILLIRRRRIS